MITIKGAGQIEKMRKAGAIVYEALQAVGEAIKPGVTTAELDEIAERAIRNRGAVPNFKNYRGFPATICASVDNVIVHGVPGGTPLKEGSIIGIDVGAVIDGYHGDSAKTFAVGRISPEAQKLIDETERCFWLAIEQARDGARIGDLAHAVQTHAESFGYGVVRAMCGHGIGTQLHEDPEVPNYGRPGVGIRLRKGMTIAVEPMITSGSYEALFLDDGTVVTKDGSLCSHYEHTICISGKGLPELLTLPDGGAWKGGRA